MIGAAATARPVLVASFTPAAVERGLSAAAVVKEAAQVIGGGGGGRARWRRPAARDAREARPGARRRARGRSRRSSARRLDARAGARLRQRPLWLRDQRPDAGRSRRRWMRSPHPAPKPGWRAIARAGRASSAGRARCVVGLPVSLSGEEGPQAAEARELRRAAAPSASTCRSRPTTSASRPAVAKRTPGRTLGGLARGGAPAARASIAERGQQRRGPPAHAPARGRGRWSLAAGRLACRAVPAVRR